jgi:gluconokinase
MVIIVMGVAGSGKTTVGQLLAGELGWSFADADHFHPPANIAKMAAGHPLDDADRAPWLAALRAHIDACLARGESAVLACSALKESYRAILVADPARVRVVHLHGSRDLILTRLNQRQNHYMRPEMLESQLATLEPPRDALSLGIAEPPAALVAKIRRAFGV